MKEFINFGKIKIPINLPEGTEILSMKPVPSLKNLSEKTYQGLKNSLGVRPLKPSAKAIVVISDNTRPVPYSGKNNILYPIIQELIKAKLSPEQITLLVATGTHRKMEQKELKKMIDSRTFELGIPIIQHDWQDKKNLKYLGTTSRNTPVFLNRYYIESDIRILTGLVESHFMAGVSGGRKSICPGLVGKKTMEVFHGTNFMASPKAIDLVLDENPCHEEALEIAKMAPPDLTINVTLDRYYKPTGVFVGSLEKAHLAAVKKIKDYVIIPIKQKYDLVITHAGFVGVNHYQTAKAAVVASYILNKNGFCVLVGRHTDPDPIGGENYKKLIRILKKGGSKKFLELISDPSWKFVPGQWQVQMWTRLFNKIPQENLIYYSKEIPQDAFSWLPGRYTRSLKKSIDFAVEQLRKKLGKEPKTAFLADGPYGIPIIKK